MCFKRVRRNRQNLSVSDSVQGRRYKHRVRQRLQPSTITCVRQRLQGFRFLYRIVYTTRSHVRLCTNRQNYNYVQYINLKFIRIKYFIQIGECIYFIRRLFYTATILYRIFSQKKCPIKGGESTGLSTPRPNPVG